MENNSKLEKDETIVIADECGDSMWYAVLAQEVPACDVKILSKDATPLSNSMEPLTGSDTVKN